MGKMQSNIKLFYLYIFLNRLDMWLPIIVLFILDMGFSLAQYAILDATWYIATLIFEVPTGAITDRVGKKNSLLISALVLSISLFILAFGNNFLAIFLSYVLWGFASSFETGTHDAFVYDSLKQTNRESDFRSVRGRITAIAILASALGSALAGQLGSIDLALPILLTACVALFLIPLILSFKEPDVSDAREPSYTLHIRASLRYALQHKLVGLLLLYSAVIGTAIWGLYIFYQPLLTTFGISVEGIGLLYLIFRVTSAAGAYFSDTIYTRVGSVTVYLIPLGFTISVISMGFFITPWVVCLILVNFFISGFYFPILRDLLNQNLPSNKRATVISLGSVISCLLSSIVYPLLGRIADLTSLQMTFKLLGSGILICMTIILPLLRREII
jgi:MFS family permease